MHKLLHLLKIKKKLKIFVCIKKKYVYSLMKINITTTKRIKYKLKVFFFCFEKYKIYVLPMVPLGDKHQFC